VCVYIYVYIYVYRRADKREPGAKLRAQLVVCVLLLRDHSARERHCALHLSFDFERHVEALQERRILTSRQYLHFCASKASKGSAELHSSSMLKRSRSPTRTPVSICTFVPVKPVRLYQ
jgi:hypothetical protein